MWCRDGEEWREEEGTEVPSAGEEGPKIISAALRSAASEWWTAAPLVGEACEVGEACVKERPAKESDEGGVSEGDAGR